MVTLSIIFASLNPIGTNGARARADTVASKLGIILSFFFLPLTFLSYSADTECVRYG